MKLIWIYLIFLAVMSLIAFCFYGADKKKARKGQWRVKESVLLGLGVFGGAVGALAGMKVFHHKTKHWYFWVINIAGLALQIVLLVLILKH